MPNISPKQPLWAATILGIAVVPFLYAISRPHDLRFDKQEIDGGASETAAVADINGDGKLDIVSGEQWYEAPHWTPHQFRQIAYTNGYVDNFSDLPIDVDGDGHVDIVSCSWFAKTLNWWKNPGRSGSWTKQPIQTGFPIEFAFLVDLTHKGKATDVLPEFGDVNAPLAWFEADAGHFSKHVVSDHSYGHGIGAGDVNGDGRTDIITPKGWFAAPVDPRSGQWTWNPQFDLGTTGFIYALDVNEDGRMDLVTSAAHDYGIFWMEQMPGGQWTKHLIDDTWSQSHAMTMIDVDGDGKPDFVTGKRYMAHDHDPGVREPLGIYWYQFLRSDDGSVSWVKHVIDYSTRTGAGMQLRVADLDRDGRLDLVAPGKSGLFYFHQLLRKDTDHEMGR